MTSLTLTTRLLLLALASLPAAAQTPAPPVPTVQNNVPQDSKSQVYKKVGDRELKVFIEKPSAWKAADERPAIVWFHGGGWVAGSPEKLREQSEYFATRGIVGIRVEYRLLGKGKQEPPTVCIQDAKSAMRWVRAHARRLGVDPHRIAAAGGSAGGHLSAFVGMVEGLDDPGDDLTVSPKADALVLFNPVFNNGPGQYGHERVGDRSLEFSPAHHISSNAPPALVFAGTKDRLIPVKTVQDFQAGMKQAGVQCQVLMYEGQGHGFFNKEPWRTRTLIAADKFLASLGWLKGAPTVSDPVPNE